MLSSQTRFSYCLTGPKMKDCRPATSCSARAQCAPTASKIHPMYLLEVKKPTEIPKGVWDCFKVRATIPADEAFRPLSEGGCPLVSR